MLKNNQQHEELLKELPLALNDKQILGRLMAYSYTIEWQKRGRTVAYFYSLIQS